MSNGIKRKIEELSQFPALGVRAVMYGYKRVGGVLTNIPAVIFAVDNKKPISELRTVDVLPSNVIIEGLNYPTDVVEDRSEVRALACYPFDSQEITRLQGSPSLLVPIMGGQEILEFPTGWSPAAGGNWTGSAGTLGFIAIDNEDGRPVGVTNAHVACGVIFKNSKRLLELEVEDPYNLYDQRVFEPTGNSYRPGAVAKSGNSVSISSPLAPNVKRYVPLDIPPNSSNNYLDVSLLSINDSLLGDQSHRIHQPSGTSPLNGGLNFSFATTSEIDGLLSSGARLYSTGRTTGPKGWGACRLVVDALFVSINVTFNYSGTNVSVPFADIIRFRYQDESTFPVAGGDSGSALLAEVGGSVKIVGLVFAGNGGSPSSPSPGTHYGYACRIDRIASEINIRAWDSSYSRISSVGTAQVLTKPYSDGSVDARTITFDGQTYYNVGMTKSSNYPIA